MTYQTNTYGVVLRTVSDGGARAPIISTLGIGFGALAIATIGFLAINAEVAQFHDTVPSGGNWVDAGTGHVIREGERQPAKKIVNGKAIAGYSSSAPRFFPVVPRVASLGFAGGVSTGAKSFTHEPLASSLASANMMVFSSQAFEHSGRASCVGKTGAIESSAHAEKITDVQWLSIDELIVALDEL